MNGDNGPDISAALDDLPASAAEGRSSKNIYARGSRGMLSNSVYHMLHHMQ